MRAYTEIYSVHHELYDATVTCSITQYENQGNRISHDILSISREILLAKSIFPYILRYTFGQSYMLRYTIIGVTQYMSVHLSMKFSDKVYTHMY